MFASAHLEPRAAATFSKWAEPRFSFGSGSGTASLDIVLATICFVATKGPFIREPNVKSEVGRETVA